MTALHRTFDATFLNQVVNHSEVRPWLGTDRASCLDLSSVLADPANIALVNEHGGFVYVKREPSVYEVHTQFLPSGRGGAALNAARQSVRYMFVTLSAKKLTTDAPEDNPGAFGLARMVGFRVIGERMDDGAQTGKVQAIREMELTREDYFNAAHVRDRGKLEAREMEPSCR